MGLLDAILGRSKPPQANLDDLFAVPQAAVSLGTIGVVPTGSGSVCFRDVEGVSDDALVDEATRVIGVDPGVSVTTSDDGHGFRWLTVTRAGGDVAGLVTDLHALNSSLADGGFGASLLCSTIGLTAPGGGPAALVYLYKQGTFYPFVPLAGGRRDNTVELQLRGVVDADLPVEPTLERWLALWDAPGLAV